MAAPLSGRPFSGGNGDGLLRKHWSETAPRTSSHNAVARDICFRNRRRDWRCEALNSISTRRWVEPSRPYESPTSSLRARTIGTEVQSPGISRLRTARLSNRSPSQEFPRDYQELLLQAKDASAAALSDGLKLLEVEFPTASLDSVPGDAEGGIEMTKSMEMLFEFSRMFTASGQTKAAARVFFPDAKEVQRAKETVFEGSPLRLSSLTEFSGFEDLGFDKKVDLTERVESDDGVFLIAYPYFNVNEMLAVEQLYDTVAQRAATPVIIFNGELDRIRSGYYPSFFYPKLAKLAKSFLPKFEAVFYLHNFKGSKGGKLFRVYPGPWQVLRKVGGSFKCIHTQDSMPTLKEVALNILSRP